MTIPTETKSRLLEATKQINKLIINEMALPEELQEMLKEDASDCYVVIKQADLDSTFRSFPEYRIMLSSEWQRWREKFIKAFQLSNELQIEYGDYHYISFTNETFLNHIMVREISWRSFSEIEEYLPLTSSGDWLGALLDLAKDITGDYNV